MTGTGTELTATHDWNLTADLPVVGPNLGLEAIAWIPDAYLVSKGFFDDSKGHLYNPGDYPDHAGGLFFVGLEGNGVVLCVRAQPHDERLHAHHASVLPPGFPDGSDVIALLIATSATSGRRAG